jgi:hypothetical protein
MVVSVDALEKDAPAVPPFPDADGTSLLRRLETETW